MHIKIIFVVSFLLQVAGLYSQPYYLRHYQVENGLSNNAVICSLQDKKGFMWFGTKDGLNRFDGYSFKTFRTEPGKPGSIGNNFIHSLYEDEDGVLWVGTESGLYSYDAATESFKRLPTNFNFQIRDILTDKKGNLWFIAGFTLLKYVKATNNLETYPVDRYFEVTSICLAADGTLWASTPEGQLKHLHAGNNSFTSYDVFSHSKTPVSKWIEKIYSTRDGAILIGTSNQGAKVFDIASTTYKDILTYNNDKTELFARNFLQTSNDEIWVATESGISIYNRKTESFTNLRKMYNDAYSLSDNAVYTFCADKEGGIWAGTYFGGINYYSKQFTPFKKYFFRPGENSLRGNVIREMRQDDKDNLWIGTEDAGLNMLDLKTGNFSNFQPTSKTGSIAYNNIHGLLVTGNELWIGTFEHGLDVMDIRTKKVIRHYSNKPGLRSLNSNFIYCIYQNRSKEILVGTTKGAFHYNRASDDFTPVAGMPLNNWYSSLLEDSQGILWAGTYGNGINFYNPKTSLSGNFRYSSSDTNALSSDRVNSVFEDSNKDLWFATEGGLCKFKRNENAFKTYTTKNGFPSNFIISLLEDDDKNLWISTTKGLVRFSLRTEMVHVYTKANGLLNDQFNFSSAHKDATGRMYFGSTKGLVSFHPKEFVQNTFVPPLYITGFQVYNRDLLIGEKGSPLKNSIIQTDKLTLPYDASTFSIDFAALNFTAPEMVEYAYKMEGLDKDWTYLKSNRKVYFTELVPGTYTFKIKAANSSGMWNEQETKLSIEILPPWWASWQAYSIYALLTLLACYFGIRNYHRNVEEKNRRKIELLEIAKEKEIFKAKIEFFTNVAHEIKTPLTLIKGPLERVIRKASDLPQVTNSLRIMEKNTNRLIDLTNQLLDFRQTEISGFSLNFVKADISETLKETYLSFKPIAQQRNILFTIKLPRTKLYGSVDIEALNKIISNLFSNALKYADKKVHIRLSNLNKGDQFFVIEIMNDGYLIPNDMREKIFEPFFRLKETEKQKGTGIGLSLSRSLTDLHKGVLKVGEPENEMNIFILTLPVHHENEFNLQSKTTNNEHHNPINNIS